MLLMSQSLYRSRSRLLLPGPNYRLESVSGVSLALCMTSIHPTSQNVELLFKNININSRVPENVKRVLSYEVKNGGDSQEKEENQEVKKKD